MVNYEKLYAFLVGLIDDAIQSICANLLDGRHGWDELNAVGVKLCDTLLSAEEMYSEEEKEHKASE